MVRDVKRLPVNLPQLADLFDQTRRAGVRAFFDRHSGELECMPRQAEVEGVFDDILAEPERWVEIQPLPPPERDDLRREFVQRQLTDPYLRLRLDEALDGDPRYRRFEAVLRESPALLDQWLAFRAAALAPLVRAWLSALGVEPASFDSPDSPVT
jgi:hypothetical protein